MSHRPSHIFNLINSSTELFLSYISHFLLFHNFLCSFFLYYFLYYFFSTCFTNLRDHTFLNNNEDTTIF